MRISRSTAGTAFVGGALILTLTALAYPSMLGVQNTASGQDRIIANTQYGPLTEADRDFVVKVRAAGLWESPLGALVIQRGGSAAMKEAGEHLVVGHGRLDIACRRIAPELGITLPNQIFSTIAKIRANTRNTLVRQLADQANSTVLDHITILEKTGLVNHEQVNLMQTSPPKMPQEQTTPPPPQPGSPVLTLKIPKELDDLRTEAPNALLPSPSAG